LQGPHYISLAPHGGFVVRSADASTVFTSSCKLLCSLSSKYGHQFGNPAGVCIDMDGSNILVADEQHHTVHLFPEHGAPVCLVSAGLWRPNGMASSSFGHLLVADAGENCVKV
ncbi:NHL-repeat-containing protein 4, partial [Phalacrocorax carbo]